MAYLDYYYSTNNVYGLFIIDYVDAQYCYCNQDIDSNQRETFSDTEGPTYA